MLDLLNRVAAHSDPGDRDPLTDLAVALAARVDQCPICHDGHVASCPVGLALTPPRAGRCRRGFAGCWRGTSTWESRPPPPGATGTPGAGPFRRGPGYSRAGVEVGDHSATFPSTVTSSFSSTPWLLQNLR